MKKSLIIVFLCLFLLGCSNVNNQTSGTLPQEEIGQSIEENLTMPDGTIIYPDGTMKLAQGSYMHGLEDSFEKTPLHSGDDFAIRNGKINGTVLLQQNIPNKKIEYTLLILVDYIQQKFVVNGKEYSCYPFLLTEEEGIKINFELPVKEADKIFTYLIVYGSNMKQLTFESEGREKFLTTSMFFSTSCYLNNYRNIQNYDTYSTVLHEIDTNMVGSPFLTKDILNHTVMPICNTSDRDVKFLFGNSFQEEKTYTMIAFEDWKQKPINKKDYEIVNLKPNKTYYCDIKIPAVEVATPYQIFMLPNPFCPTRYERPLATLRTIITPLSKEENENNINFSECNYILGILYSSTSSRKFN